MSTDPARPPSSTTPRRLRVLLVDDHPIVRDGIATVLNTDPAFEICGHAESVPAAKRELREKQPDVLITDIMLKVGDGFELVRDARSQYDRLRILVLSMQDEAVYANRMLGAGANGYLMKGSAPTMLLTALHRIAAGGVYVSEAISEQLLESIGGRSSRPPSPIDDLTDRELQVLHLIGRGRSTREIANELNLSQKTVESHKQRIKRKLNLHTSAQLVQYAVNWAAGRMPARPAHGS